MNQNKKIAQINGVNRKISYNEFYNNYDKLMFESNNNPTIEKLLNLSAQELDDLYEYTEY